MENSESTIANDEKAAPERIGFGKRLGAYLLDIVISGIVGAVIGMFAGASLAAIFFSSGAGEGMEEAEAMGGGVAAMLGGALGSVAGMMLFFLILMLMEAFTGQTLGKMILGIKNGNDDGTPAGVGKLITRAVAKYISTICTLLAGITGVAMIATAGNLLGLVIFIGCFFVLGANHQAFHDMLAKTAVYNKSDL